MKPIFGLMLILMLAACGGGGEAQDDSAATDPLLGTSWQLKYIRKTMIPSDVTITATFAEGQISGKSACNNYFASYEIKDGAITFGPVGATKMMCQDEVMAWEHEFMEYLGAADRFEFQDGLLMIFQGHEALSFAPAEPGS